MNLNQISLTQIINQVRDIIVLVVGFVLALFLLATAFRSFGHPIPYIAAMDPTSLAYLCGAYWLYRR